MTHETGRSPVWPDLSAYDSTLKMVQTPEGRRALVTCASEISPAWRATIEARVGRDAWGFDPGLGGFVARAPMKISELRAWFPALTFAPAPPQAQVTLIQSVRPSQVGERPIVPDEVPGGLRYPGGVEARDMGRREDGKYAWGVIVRGDAGVVFSAATSDAARLQAEDWAVRAVAGASSHESALVRAAEDGVQAILKRCAPGFLDRPLRRTDLDPGLLNNIMAMKRDICAHARVLRDVGGRSDAQLEALTEGVWKQTAIGACVVSTPTAKAAVERLAGTYDRAMAYYLFPAHMRADVETEFGDQIITIPAASCKLAGFDPSGVLTWKAIWARESASEGTASPEASMVRFSRALCAELPGVRQAGKDVVASIEKALARPDTTFTGESVEAAILLIVDRAEAATTATEGEIAALEKVVAVADAQLEDFDLGSYVTPEGGLRLAALERTITGLLEQVPTPAALKADLATPVASVRACQGFRALLGHLCPEPGGVSAGLPGLLERMDRTLARWREQVLVTAESVGSLRESATELLAQGKRYEQLRRLTRIGDKETAMLAAKPAVRGPDGLSKAWFPLRFAHGSGYSDGMAIDFVGSPHITTRITDPDPRLTVAHVQRVIDRSSTPRAPGRPIALWDDADGHGAVVGLEVNWKNLPDAPVQTAVVPIKASYVQYFKSKHPNADVQFEVPTPAYRSTGVMVVADGKPLGMVIPMTAVPPPFNSRQEFEALMVERADLERALGVDTPAAVSERHEVDAAA